MPFDLFSKRKKKAENAGKPDVYTYDELPKHFRMQVVHILDRALGDFQPYPEGGYGRRNSPTLWEMIEKATAEEHGEYVLGKNPNEEPRLRLLNYILGVEDTDLALDAIEMAFMHIDEHIERGNVGMGIGKCGDARQARDDLNLRFREHSIGYQYENGQIVRVDSQYVHAEVVKPALALLTKRGFKGPQDEFLEAHTAYREGRGEDAIVAANKAFESTMKVMLVLKEMTPQRPTRAAADRKARYRKHRHRRSSVRVAALL